VEPESTDRMPDDSGFHCPGQVVTVFSPYATKVAL
jgi:hypothetical protein